MGRTSEAMSIMTGTPFRLPISMISSGMSVSGGVGCRYFAGMGGLLMFCSSTKDSPTSRAVLSVIASS